MDRPDFYVYLQFRLNSIVKIGDSASACDFHLFFTYPDSAPGYQGGKKKKRRKKEGREGRKERERKRKEEERRKRRRKKGKRRRKKKEKERKKGEKERKKEKKKKELMGAPRRGGHGPQGSEAGSEAAPHRGRVLRLRLNAR